MDEYGEPMFGAVAFVVGTTNSSPIDFDGNFELRNVEKGAAIRVTLMGYKCDDQIWKGGTLKFVMKEESTALDEVVVTAMGIMRKEKSLTYATQLIKADELLKAPDANIANSLEGKISGITITLVDFELTTYINHNKGQADAKSNLNQVAKLLIRSCIKVVRKNLRQHKSHH